MEAPEPKDGSAPPVALAAIVVTVLATFGFVGYRTVASVSASSGYVVHVADAARHSNTDHASRTVALAKRVATAVRTRPTVAERARAGPSPLPSTASTPSSPPSASSKPIPSPHASPISDAPHAPSHARPGLAHHLVARAQPHRVRRDEFTGTSTVASTATDPERIVAATSPPGVASAPGAIAPTAEPAPSATAAQVALAPATPIYAPDRIVEARVRNAVQPDFPIDPNLAGVRATAIVLVTIGPTGHVTRTTIEKTSGYGALDRSAIAAARLTEYYAPNIDGRPATETYRMIYDFR